MADPPIYISARDAERLLDRETVLRVVEEALKALSDQRLVNGSKGGFSLDDGAGRRHMGRLSGCDIGAGIAGVKWFVACDGNGQRGLRVPFVVSSFLQVP